jgi:hypothetical protein
MATIQFQVKLENVELTKSQVTLLEKEINAVVGKHIIKAVPPATAIGTKIRINPEWLGIWLKKFKDLGTLKDNLDFKRFKM